MADLLRKQLLLHEETKNRRKRSDCGHHKEKYIEDNLNQFKIRHALTPFHPSWISGVEAKRHRPSCLGRGPRIVYHVRKEKSNQVLDFFCNFPYNKKQEGMAL